MNAAVYYCPTEWPRAVSTPEQQNCVLNIECLATQGTGVLFASASTSACELIYMQSRVNNRQMGCTMSHSVSYEV